jgi:hypothetical protein
MITYYLRFPSQDDWESAAAEAGFRVNNPILIEVTPESFDPDTGETHASGDTRTAGRGCYVHPRLGH